MECRSGPSERTQKTLYLCNSRGHRFKFQSWKGSGKYDDGPIAWVLVCNSKGTGFLSNTLTWKRPPPTNTPLSPSHPCLASSSPFRSIISLNEQRSLLSCFGRTTCILGGLLPEGNSEWGWKGLGLFLRLSLDIWDCDGKGSRPESMSLKSHRDKASHNESQVQSRWGFGTMGWLGYLLGFHSQSVLPMHAVKTVF